MVPIRVPIPAGLQPGDTMAFSILDETRELVVPESADGMVTTEVSAHEAHAWSQSAAIEVHAPEGAGSVVTVELPSGAKSQPVPAGVARGGVFRIRVSPEDRLLWQRREADAAAELQFHEDVRRRAEEETMLLMMPSLEEAPFEPPEEALSWPAGAEAQRSPGFEARSDEARSPSSGEAQAESLGSRGSVTVAAVRGSAVLPATPPGTPLGIECARLASGIVRVTAVSALGRMSAWNISEGSRFPLGAGAVILSVDGSTVDIDALLHSAEATGSSICMEYELEAPRIFEHTPRSINEDNSPPVARVSRVQGECIVCGQRTPVGRFCSVRCEAYYRQMQEPNPDPPTTSPRGMRVVIVAPSDCRSDADDVSVGRSAAPSLASVRSPRSRSASRNASRNASRSPGRGSRERAPSYLSIISGSPSQGEARGMDLGYRDRLLDIIEYGMRETRVDPGQQTARERLDTGFSNFTQRVADLKETQQEGWMHLVSSYGSTEMDVKSRSQRVNLMKEEPALLLRIERAERAYEAARDKMLQRGAPVKQLPRIQDTDMEIFEVTVPTNTRGSIFLDPLDSGGMMMPVPDGLKPGDTFLMDRGLLEKEMGIKEESVNSPDDLFLVDRGLGPRASWIPADINQIRADLTQT